jgi:hypothetical protein
MAQQQKSPNSPVPAKDAGGSPRSPVPMGDRPGKK